MYSPSNVRRRVSVPACDVPDCKLCAAPLHAHWKPSAVAAFAVGVLVGAFFTALFLLVALGDR